MLALLYFLFPTIEVMASTDQWNPGFGLMIPTIFSDTAQPQPLPVDDLRIEIQILENIARISTTIIFLNTGETELEGKFIYRLPAQGIISSFALWDGAVRIPGVIVERRKAKRIYEEITARKRDPGLLSAGTEDSGDDSMDSRLFSCKVFPVPARASKRVEITYDALLPIDSSSINFTLPLISGKSMTVNKYEITVRLDAKIDLKSCFATLGSEEKKFSQKAVFKGEKRIFNENFNLCLNLNGSDNQFIVATAPENDRSGFFMALASIADKKSEICPPTDTIFALDTSFSMNPELLEKGFEILVTIIGSMKPSDRFGVILFNDQINEATDGLVQFSPAQAGLALNNIKAHLPGGGTDIGAALRKATNIFSAADSGIKSDSNERLRNLILITDGFSLLPEPNLKDTRNALDNLFEVHRDLRISIIAMGNRLKNSLLTLPTGQNTGFITWCSSADQPLFLAKSMASKLREQGFLKPSFQWSAMTDQVYISDGIRSFLPADAPPFYNGQGLCFLGRYSAPDTPDSTPWTFEATPRSSDGKLIITGESKATTKPKTSTSDPTAVSFSGNEILIARMWAMARIDHLVRLQNNRGEDKTEIEEIITLSKSFSIVTPYTSFLAAPRALLRPRIIQPGDPEITVTTNSEVERIIAIFPFGESRSMHLESDESDFRKWKIRFLAPPWLEEGRHTVELILTDRSGTSYRESKWFTIDSSPPSLTLTASSLLCNPGELIELMADASSDTRRIIAYIPGAPPAELKYSSRRKASVGKLMIPPSAAGLSFELRVVAEDFARNSTSRNLRITVTGSSMKGGVK
jgi:Ca-activated chloride channel family protein